MPTPIAAFRAKLVQERTLVAEALALVDFPDEDARMAAAEATFLTAQALRDKAAQRHTLAYDKVNRLEVLDAQIAIMTP